MKNREKGFTLIEFIIVCAIVSILAAAIVPHIVGKGGTSPVQKAHEITLGE